MKKSVNRRAVLAALASLATMPARANPMRMTVYRSPTCGCCISWVRYIEREGLTASIINQADLAPVKKSASVPEALQSCHTAFVEGYVIEGHVPVEAIKKLLAERPQILGLAVPDMPVGSPGMEMPGTKPEPFSVMAFHKNGSPTVFLDYPEGYRKPA